MFAIGEAVMLNVEFPKAEKGAQAIVVDGQKEFPAVYNTLQRLSSSKQQLKYGNIIFVRWNQSDPRWKGEIDGSVHASYFDLFQQKKAQSTVGLSKTQKIIPVPPRETKIKVNLGKINQPTEPKNNDGRKDCFWCAHPTKKVPFINTVANVCVNCKR